MASLTLSHGNGPQIAARSPGQVSFGSSSPSSFQPQAPGRSRSSRLAASVLVGGLLATLLAGAAAWTAEARGGEGAVDFNRDIRPLLSNYCYTCHGPDASERQSGLRLDEFAGATAAADSGEPAIRPGKPEASPLLARVASADPDLRMPPAESGKQLKPADIELLKRWIAEGATYARHWSYEPPRRPEVPEVLGLLASHPQIPEGDAVRLAAWPRNPVDHFVLAQQLRRGLRPSGEADRHALIRRVSLDLTGLPPTPREVAEFLNDAEPGAYERLVDRLLDKQAYGEHWARKWLDLARYADSAGYADDPPRTIWAYRDWVIRAFNRNQPFDQFTIEQLAGDLLPDPSEDQLVATAFHRNTLTNNEGGTNDEEFRNVAVVDRVNTTLAVWMGTTINCAQCHNHKYDPISQREFFQLFAIFNGSADADRRDESPLVQLYTAEQRRQQQSWQAEIEALKRVFETPTPELIAAQREWEQGFAAQLAWRSLPVSSAESREGTRLEVQPSGAVLASDAREADTYTVQVQLAPEQAAQPSGPLTAIQLETLPHASLPAGGSGFGGGNFVISRVSVELHPGDDSRPRGRYVRIENPGQQKILSLAEVQVLSGGDNLAGSGTATQSSTDYDGPPKLAIDGNTNGDYQAKSVTHTRIETDPWWELDLGEMRPIDQLVLYNRTDNGLHTRLANFRVAVLDDARQVVWEKRIADPPNPSVALPLSGVRPLPLAAAYADYSQSGFEAQQVLAAPGKSQAGWAVGGQTDRPHQLLLVLAQPLEARPGDRLSVVVEQRSSHKNHGLGHFRLAATSDARAADFGRTPADLVDVARQAPGDRTPEQQESLTRFYLGSVAPMLADQRARLAKLEADLAAIKPATSVPVMRELPADQRRTTRIQRRGNFLDTGDEVQPGLPQALLPLAEARADDRSPLNRLDLARWLVDPANPLTARVVANRYWEAIFGRGLVVTSEEFGSQGEPPTHPQLLDWLATELVRSGWDRKALLKLIVTSATYRQQSALGPELLDRDPDNTWLARGPRFRLSAEMIRDQALFVSGLLSPRMYGPPVKPPQPTLGVNAAFGGGIDWKTSDGEDRYRRGLYTTWRRSNPYPSMATFDAPNREVCTIRRDRTNTPLQALVTLNDPVYVEAAQALARQLLSQPGSDESRIQAAYLRCLARPPQARELEQLLRLLAEVRKRLGPQPEQARQLATEPLGPLPDELDAVDAAAWTVAANVLLNLDELFMKR